MARTPNQKNETSTEDVPRIVDIGFFTLLFGALFLLLITSIGINIPPHSTEWDKVLLAGVLLLTPLHLWTRWYGYDKVFAIFLAGPSLEVSAYSLGFMKIGHNNGLVWTALFLSGLNFTIASWRYYISKRK